MTILTPTLKTPIVYPDSDGNPMAESDPARDYLIYCISALSLYFANREDVYVSGNLYIYYKQNVADAVIAPDVFVVFGVSNKKRLSYKIWEEKGKAPDWVLEVTSATTRNTDEEEKPQKYAQMQVGEYFQYDPTGDYLQPQLKGSRLVNGNYQPIAPESKPGYERSIASEVLGLDLRLVAGELRFYDPTAERKLLSHQEIELARQRAELSRQEAELARQEAELARQQAEEERLAEARERREAIPRLLGMGLNVEQVAAALNLPISEVQQLAE